MPTPSANRAPLTQLDRIERKLDAFRLAKNVKDWILFGLIGCMAAWNVYCQRRMDQIDANILEVRRIIAMQREDPKAFPRLKKQFEEIERYESGNGSRDR